jgi:hypothetical protein
MFGSSSFPTISGTQLQTVPKRYYGKYRGKVVENLDPLVLGRIIAMVPAVSEMPMTWAMPCVPYAGMQVGFFAIPPIEANVWIEFEAGDPNYPIWTGCFWEEGQVPLENPLPGIKIFKTECITLIMNDEPEVGGVTLEVNPPAVATPISILMNSAGIEITTEATFDLTSEIANVTASASVSVETEETNLTSSLVTVESEEVNLTSQALTIESEETNLAGAALTVETEETNIAGASLSIESGETNIASAAFTVESAETNIASAALTIEAADTNIAGAVTIEGALLVDGLIPLLLPL